MVRVLFLFLTLFHVNFARSNGNPTWRAFQSYGVMLRFAAEAIFKDLFNKNGGVFSNDKNPHLPQNYKKNNALSLSLFFLFVCFMCIIQKRQSVQWPRNISISTPKTHTHTKKNKQTNCQ